MAKRPRVQRDWPKVLAAQAASTLSIAAFCRQEGINLSLFHRRRRDGLAAVTPATAGRFIELQPQPPSSSGSGVSIVTARGWRIEVAPDFDAATLDRLLDSVHRHLACWR